MQQVVFSHKIAIIMALYTDDGAKNKLVTRWKRASVANVFVRIFFLLT